MMTLEEIRDAILVLLKENDAAIFPSHCHWDGPYVGIARGDEEVRITSRANWV